jgi:hypothetical protein
MRDPCTQVVDWRDEYLPCSKHLIKENKTSMISCKVRQNISQVNRAYLKIWILKDMSRMELTLKNIFLKLSWAVSQNLILELLEQLPSMPAKPELNSIMTNMEKENSKLI